MLKQDSNPMCGVLYIDDEEKALKYFRMAFSAKFNVFTAESGRTGLEILRREAKNIGIVISDQRMPEMLGAEILGIVREEFPRIVRILTTAYSDLDSAIQAVNKGHIYQYVVKPWEVTELGMLLRRAADYHHVLSERDELLALKMTTLQRIICNDRLKWLLLASRFWDEKSQPALRRAVIALINALPKTLKPIVSGEEQLSIRNLEVSALIRAEYRNALQCIDSIESLRTLTTSQEDKLSPEIPEILSETFEAFISSRGTNSWRLIAVNRLKTLLASMIKDHKVAPNQIAATISSSDDAPGIVINFQLDETSFSIDDFSKTLFGILLMEKTPRSSLLLFEALIALAINNDFLTLSIESKNKSEEALVLKFPFPENSSDSPDEAIDCLAEKFASWDISEL